MSQRKCEGGRKKNDHGHIKLGMVLLHQRDLSLQRFLVGGLKEI